MNMAAACLVLQGCKANRTGKELPPPEVMTIDRPAGQPTQEPTVTEIEATPPAPSATVPAPRHETMPPAPTTRTVKALPPPARPAEAKRPAVASASAPAAVTVHTVKKGDLLSSISRKYNVKMSAIVAANPGINPDRIRIGQKLNIPGSAAAPKSDVMLAAAPAPAGVAPAAANTVAPVKVKPAFKPYTGPVKEYVVKGGDSLGKIALASGISIRALKELNGLRKDNVRVGQKLKVPAEKVVSEKPAADKPVAKKTEAPTVAEKKDAAAEKKDDTAPAPVEEKKPAEAATPAPAADAAAAPAAVDAPKDSAAPAEPAVAVPAPAGNTYTVKEGDDIVSISIAWGISPSQLMNANDLKDNEPLKPGTVLKLPPNARQTVQ
ncbi:MAG: LysM peptidoglycan-binding domain-containing protein [Kiritimatiellae bacterium]|nr:LysM peptidoglycan-binding domain-containing protein [Kiritimatiellia bacterium]